ALMTYSTSSAKDDSLSLNGFSGLYNVPNAHVTEYGTGIASYSDMMFFNDEYRHNNNIVGSFGVLPHVEVSGRIAWFNSHTNFFESEEPEARDLSANIKINIPFIPEDWFHLAIGEQDVGGAASFFDAQYIVASKRIGPVRIDAGVGKNDTTGRLDGAFGGVEFSPFEWISLLAEYDAQDTNTGFRLSTPESWLPKGARVDLTVLADSDNETANGKSFYGVGFKFPLGGGFTKERPKQHPRTDVAELSRPFKSVPMHYAASKFGRVKSRKNTVTDTPRNAVHSSISAPTNSASLATSKEIAKRLEKHGFERIDVGIQGNTLIVAFENNVYNRSEIDAISVALNTITDAAK
ncbi:MAG: YjbH domain-containing protein, partial [Pseudomonadales bacterium]|nr:YjbH domain-containing protein [Pseudomonadales bacterium]